MEKKASAGTNLRNTPDAAWVHSWLASTLPLLTALLLKAGKGYRAFPSLDDFAYLPLSYRFLDSTLYTRDLIVQGYSFHLPLWAYLIWMLERSLGLAFGFWLCTLALAILTVTAAWSLLRALGGPGFLLPLAALLAFAGRTPGIGRGLYGGAFGDSFHMQWLALALLLWTYDRFIRGNTAWTGVLLGLTTLAHPVVGVHGAFVIFVAWSVSPGRKLKRLVGIALITALMSIPVTLPQFLHLATVRPAVQAWTTADIILQGYLFRTSHEFTLELTTVAAAMSLILLAVLAIAGTVLLGQYRMTSSLKPCLGIFLGHGFLLVVAAVFHGPSLPPAWKLTTTLPYLLHLTRTTPLFVVLASILAVAGLEAMLESKNPGDRPTRLLRIVFLIALFCFATIFVEWNRWFLAVLVLAVFNRFLNHRTESSARFKKATAAVTAILAAGLLVLSYPERLAAPVSPAEKELYRWIRTQTSPQALFIVPPSFQEFRTYTKRSAYVDFKVFPASTPNMVRQWRERLEKITVPDRTARDLNGWEAMYHWDRCYAQNNPPERIFALLEETGADYFLQDGKGHEIPPFLPIEDREFKELQVVFSNQRFKLLRQRGMP